MKMIFGILAAVAVAAAETSFAQTDVQLPYGAPQVLQLAKAGINDGTILTYIQNSGTIYNLNADQIVYLKQQGVSDTVINAMINQRTAVAAQNAVAAQTTAAAPATTIQNNYNYAPAPEQSAVTTTYVQTVPSSSIYVIPDSRTYAYYNYWPYSYPRYYGYYGYYSYPTVSVSLGFGGFRYGGWHGSYGVGFRGHWH